MWGLGHGGGLRLGDLHVVEVVLEGNWGLRVSEGSSCTGGEVSNGAMVVIFVIFGNDYHPRWLALC